VRSGSVALSAPVAIEPRGVVLTRVLGLILGIALMGGLFFALSRVVFWLLRRNELYSLTIKALANERVPDGALLFTGSSTIRFWDSLGRDFASWPVVNRGFGGAVVSQVVHFANDIVPEAKSVRLGAIVFYCGGNDLSWGVSVDAVVNGVEQFLAIAKDRAPETPVYVLSVCKTPSRRLAWRKVTATNERLQALCEKSSARWVDVTTPMSTERGRPRRSLYRFDGVHPNERGYAVWASVLRPRFEAELG
jgi:lysophospholipase L1-like esterase